MINSLQKKLSIGIPTYNNPAALQRQLDSIFKQIEHTKKYRHEIEIIVSDNSTNDETEKILTIFKTKTPVIIYIKNGKNIGFDRNLDQVLTTAGSIFCWTLSDNDVLEEDALEKILICLNSVGTEAPYLCIRDTKDNEGIKMYTNAEDAITSNNNSILSGLVSRNIFNTDYLPKNRANYHGNQWLHVSIMFDMCARRKFITIPNIFKEDTGTDECRWAAHGNTFITYTSLHSIVMNLTHFGYSDTFLQTYHKAFIKNLPHQVVTAKLFGLRCTRKNLKILVTAAKKEPFILFFCFCVIITPLSILKIFKTLWKKL